MESIENNGADLMGEEINSLMKELVEEMGFNEIIAIIYNPYKSGMESEDCIFLKNIFSRNDYYAPLFILNGKGGAINSGIYFPYIIKKAVKNYQVYIPGVCCSALCYTLLKSSKLFVGENTTITQIDPTFEYHGQILRAIKVMKDKSIKDLRLKEFARKIFNFAEEEIRKLIEKPSLFREEGLEYFEFMHLNELVTLFMNKKGHYDPIRISELIKLDANVENLKNTMADNVANRLIQKCQDFLIASGARAIFVSSTPMKVSDIDKGSFNCPLN